MKVSSLIVVPIAPFLKPEDPDMNFYNELYHYLTSGTLPHRATEAYKKIIKKRATNYLVTRSIII